LVCPLNWGLGHATRCIPIIKELQLQGAEVVIAGEGGSLKLLKEEFPNLTFIYMPGYDIFYPKNMGMSKSIALSTPKLIYKIYKEHIALKRLMKKWKFDVVISDNRYGLWNRQAKSIFITHQLQVKSTKRMQFLEPLLFKVSSYFISKYDLCWVPDFEGSDNLSGDLSHEKTLPNVRFIGPISRFADMKNGCNKTKGKHSARLLVILSGPEPQRTIFERTILKQLPTDSFETTIIRGVVTKTKPKENGITMYNYLGAKAMKDEIQSADIILSRPGYSSIMDLASIGKRAIFVPTPGQTEQEYLAAVFMKKRMAYSEPQEGFSLSRALKRSIGFCGLSAAVDNQQIKEEVGKILC
jgi:hypothetical protein